MPRNSDAPLIPLTRLSTSTGSEEGSPGTMSRNRLADSLAQPAKAMVAYDGTDWVMIDGPTGLFVSKTNDVDAAVDAATAHLTGGRTWVEKILFTGLFPTLAPIVLDSYTAFDLSAARIVPTSSYSGSVSIITNELHAGVDGPKNKEIHIIGGGSGLVSGINTYGGGIGAISNIELKNIEKSSVWGMRSEDAREHGIAFDYSDMMMIMDNDAIRSGDDGITCHYINNNYFILFNRCYDGLLNTGSPSLGAKNGIELENETSGTESAPLNGVVAHNICHGNKRGIVIKTESTKTTPIKYHSVDHNICYANTLEGIMASNHGVGAVKLVGMHFDHNILYGSITGTGMRLEDMQGATIHGGSIYGNKIHGVELTDCDDTKFGGGVLIHENQENGVRGGATVTATKFAECSIIDNAVDVAKFSYAINLDGADTYIGPLATIKDTRGTPLQHGVKVPATATRMKIDGPTADGWKDPSGTKHSPVYVTGSIPTDFMCREVRTIASTALVTENEGEETGLSTTDTIPHGIDLGQAAVTDVSNSSVFGITVIAESGTVGNIITTVDDDDITVTFTGGGTIDVKWWIRAHRWSA